MCSTKFIDSFDLGTARGFALPGVEGPGLRQPRPELRRAPRSWVGHRVRQRGRPVDRERVSQRVASGWEVFSYSVVQVESTEQSEYVPQGNLLFAHVFLFRR